jgi:preprotein translocase subunit YajC
MKLMFLNLAMAPPAEGGSQPGGTYWLVMMALMIGVFYIMLIRPQQRREKQRRAMIDSIKSGDRVLFSGGIIGTVSNVKEKVLTVKVAEKVKIEVARGAVNQVLAKGETPPDNPSA